MTSRPAISLLLLAGACLGLAGCGAASADRSADPTDKMLAELRDVSPKAFVRLQHDMSRDSLALASRFDPAAHADPWGRPMGWAALDLAKSATLPWGKLSQADAAAVNALLPVDDADFAPAEPFILRADGPERDRALLCLTQAVYYEAALEPLEGQQAVAQEMINRMRHPDFPKSICGVVYEGSELPIGCQFSFTCDGSLLRPPIEPYWSRAQEVAEAAIDGFVAKAVGPATHYHADYVFPTWGSQMVKITELGAHIFYRFPGPAGDPTVLHGRYAGNELGVSMTTPANEAIQLAAADLASGKYDAMAKLLTPVVPPPASASVAAPTQEPAIVQAPPPAAVAAPTAPPPAPEAAPVRRAAPRQEPRAPADDLDAPIATAQP